MTTNDIRLDFWQRNSAADLESILSGGEIVTTFGAWSLENVSALMRPCGENCRAFLGNGHTSECGERFE